MKKKYLTPKIRCTKILTSPLMLTASGNTGNTGVGEGSAGNNTPDLIGRDLGDWDNIWK